MQTKRKLVDYDGDTSDHHDTRNSRDLHSSTLSITKRARAASLPRRDTISTLSDEMLVRVLSFMDEQTLLAIAPVSKRFNRVASDSQLWRPHYYRRFILPRAHMIPGFRRGASRSSGKLRYSRTKSIWADGGWGRRGGFINHLGETGAIDSLDPVDWKKQYKLRHNWARGTCAVEEVQVRDIQAHSIPTAERQTLVKVVDGLAVTVDAVLGIRAWNLKNRRRVAHASFEADKGMGQPSCLAVDDFLHTDGLVDVVVGFENGAFGIWRLDVNRGTMSQLYRHTESCFGELVAIAYSHPFILTASKSGCIALSSFESPESLSSTPKDNATFGQVSTPSSPKRKNCETTLSQPQVLTSLKSQSTRLPLALSIRRAASSVVASVAYTFDSIGGWAIGIQDLDINPLEQSRPTVVTSRVAYTLPTRTRGSTGSSPSSSPSHARSRSPIHLFEPEEDGPIRLSYSHPYMLATLPDNTLVLHMCTSTSSSLSISPGIRLWGHTSGISDAEITPRGKAVSVSMRGNEIRVWELEGRVAGSSVEVRPRQPSDDAEGPLEGRGSSSSKFSDASIHDKRNWVGFDEEMVVVLKEAQDGRESLLVYDFS